MTDHVARLYGLVVGVLVFFAAWAAVVALPWATTATSGVDPRLAALSARQQRVHLESLRVQKVVNARWAAYHAALAKRNAAAATLATSAAPSVKVVTLPPLTVTRVS
jgi:zinc transporter ZupT